MYLGFEGAEFGMWGRWEHQWSLGRGPDFLLAEGSHGGLQNSPVIV
jgi:hypothetical protein